MLEKINHKIVSKEVVNALTHLYHQGEFLQILEKEKQFASHYQDSIEVLNIFGSLNTTTPRSSFISIRVK